jgi:hypothetical protein
MLDLTDRNRERAHSTLTMNDRAVTQQQLDAANLYADLLEEAKVRIFSIDAVIGGGAGIPDPLAREYAYLQLRMLCEVIALGCLVAHGDLSVG